MIVYQEEKKINGLVNWSTEVLKYKILPVMNLSDKDLDPDVIYYFDRYTGIIIINLNTFNKLDLCRGYNACIICADNYIERKTIQKNKFKKLEKYDI